METGIIVGTLLAMFSYLFYRLGKIDGKDQAIALFFEVLMQSRSKDKLVGNPNEILQRMKIRNDLEEEIMYELNKK